MLIDDLLTKFKEGLPSTFIVPIEAERFVQQVQTTHPDALAEWMHAHAVEFIGTSLRRQLHADRQRARGSRRAQFAMASKQYNPADPESVDVFAQRFVVDNQNMWRKLGEMTGPDHEYVAGQYEATGKRALMEAAYHRAIAKHIGDRRTDEVFSASELTALRERFVK